MKLLFDLFPVILFFVAYKAAGIYVATAVAIAASFIQVGLYWLKRRRFETMHLVSLGLIAVFGGATLLLQDPVFIKWKPTILNWLFAAVFVGSQFVGEKPLVQRLMGHAVQVPDFAWRRVNLLWAAFFVLSGVANLFVAFNYSEDTWVNFKLFGLMGMTFVFIIAQSFYLARFMVEETEEA